MTRLNKQHVGISLAGSAVLQMAAITLAPVVMISTSPVPLPEIRMRLTPTLRSFRRPTASAPSPGTRHRPFRSAAELAVEGREARVTHQGK